MSRVHYLTLDGRDGTPAFHDRHPLDGDPQLTYIRSDAGELAVCPSAVDRVLKTAARLDGWTRRPSKKGAGFDQPTQTHEQIPDARQRMISERRPIGSPFAFRLR
jgi:putative transposase